MYVLACIFLLYYLQSVSIVIAILCLAEGNYYACWLAYLQYVDSIGCCWTCRRILLSMLNGAYNTLLKQSGSEARCHLSAALESPVMAWNNLSASEAEITVIFCICILAEIGNAKNNIIGVCFCQFIFSMFPCPLVDVMWAIMLVGSSRRKIYGTVLRCKYPVINSARLRAFWVLLVLDGKWSIIGSEDLSQWWGVGQFLAGCY